MFTVIYPLPGEDFDNTILEYLVGEFKRDQGIDLSKDRLAVQRLREGESYRASPIFNLAVRYGSSTGNRAATRGEC